MAARVRVGHFGSRMYYGVPRALESLGMLEKLYTDFTINKGIPGLIASVLPGTKMKNRKVQGIPASKIVHLPDYGLQHALRMRGVRDEKTINTFYFEHGKRLERRMMTDGMKGITAVTLIGSSSQFIFAEARKKGITTIAEQIIAPAGTYLEILNTLLAPYRDWETIETTRDSLDYWQDVSLKEWEHTDYLLCGSKFVRDSVMKLGMPEQKLIVIPYGVPSLGLQPAQKQYDGKRKLKVLFVGTVCLRKGIQYLLEIAREVSDFCEIKICGNSELKPTVMDRFRNWVSFEGHVSRAEVNAWYDWADVFVLPSLFEGSATVCYEAIQHALPIITTPNSGIFLEDGDGMTMIGEANHEDLKNALVRYHTQPRLVAQQSALLKRKLSYASFEGYSARLEDFFRVALDTSPIQ